MATFGTNGVTTTLAVGCGVNDLTLYVTSTASGFPGVGVSGSRQPVRVDNEFMLLDYVVASGVIKVMMRGNQGTTAQAHDILATVATTSTPADFLALPTGYVAVEPWDDDILTIGEDLTFTAAGTKPVAGTSIPLPIKNTTYYINKASAAAITLISGTAAQVGVRVRFVNQVAAANTIDYTPGFLGDTTSSNLATAVAKVGATFDIVCGPTGLWGPVNASANASTANWTLS